MVNAIVTSDGELSFEGQSLGRLQGFRFTPEASLGTGPANIAAGDVASALAEEFEVRANRLSEAVDASLVLANDGAIRWLGDPIAKIAVGDALLAPRALILVDENLTEAAQQKVQGRVDLWLNAYVHRLLGPLFELEAAAGLEGAAHNVAQQLAQALGVLERSRVAQEVKALDQNARGLLRKLGVRFGAHYVYIPGLVKPAIRVLATQLWALQQGGGALGAGLDEIPQLAASGRTSFVADAAISRDVYRVAGFRLCGDRAVRVDIVERLSDLIRPAIAYKPGPNAGPPPPGSADADGFVVTGAMTSLTGCSGEQFASVLRSLGFVSERVKGPALTIAPSAPEIPPTESQAEPAPEGEVEGEPPSEANAEPAEITQSPASEPAVAAAVEEAAPAIESAAPEEPAAGAEAEAPASGEVAAPDAAAGDAPVESQPEPAALIEAELIEVWRPKPPNRQHRRPRLQERNAAEGEQRPKRREGASERFRNRRAAAPPPAAGAPEQPPAKEEAAPARWAGKARRPHERSGKSENGRRPSFGKGGHEERRNEERRPEPAPPPKREAPVNLNSPFAKLLALKSQLEAKGKG